MTSSAFIMAASGAVAAGALGTCISAMIRPTSQFYGRVYSRGGALPDRAASRYALTFDDGPTPSSTDAILDALGELNVRAAFFVVGINARRSPELIQRMYREGHIVANHSFDHPHFGMLRGSHYWRHQIHETDVLIEQIIGRRPLMFRPPLGVKTWSICAAAAQSGHATVTWSRRGYDGVATTPQAILDRLVPRTVSGDVLLLHDGVEPHSRRDPSITVGVVKPLVKALRDRGLQPAALDELLDLPAYTPNSSPAASAIA